MSIPIWVRYSDLDTFAHVNNAVYLSYLEEARAAYYRALHSLEPDLPEFKTLVARSEVDYLRPILLGQRVEVHVRVTAVGNKSFRTAYAIYAEEALAAKAQTVQVWMHEEQSARVPEVVRRAIRKLEAEPVEGL
ncbi:thioesterase family protein [Meiothermus sp. Pnk-1]|uniref:acyl-CoA thioesterase n=1 Tax=Meiothermus sp. Pnk-1 TaxID=873128 RepID=UPI001F17C492|nr:thioesterase family protein [Meiothermus sp. Pnk-1]